MSAYSVVAAVKTVTWTLPADWEGRLELDQIGEPVGAPSVAYYNALIEVPSTATNFTITASDVAYRASELGRPAPVLEPSVVGEPQNAPVEDPALYATVYPADVFEKGEPWEMDGKTYLPVRIKVYRWNGPDNKVEALESLKLTIDCEFPRATLKRMMSAVPTAKVDYIVVSPPDFAGYWQKFVDYRKTTHPNMTFEIVNTDDIYAKYAGHDDALKLHHFIEDMYAKGTRYILLGAGAQHTSYSRSSMIPTRIVITQGGRTQGCDYYYCVVEKPSGAKEVWDYNGDGIYLASKNPNGGYYADATSQFSWTGAMKVHRFSARTSISMGGKTRSAQQQIEGYVEKLKRYEQGLFDGRFSQAVLANTLSESYNRYHGNTSAECTMERQFYDLGANIFSEEHGSITALNEYETRERSPSYFTLHRPVGYNRSVLQRYYSNGETADDFYKRNFETMIINSHGSPEAVEPLHRNGVFNATGLCGFHLLIVPCHAGNPCADPNTEVSIAEAGVVNPEGGSLVAFGNSNTGLWGGKDTYSEKIERDVIKMLYRCQNGSFNDAGSSRLWAMNNYKWNTLSPNSPGGLLMCDSMAYGDPLVKLTDIWSREVDADGVWHRGDELTIPTEQEFASTLTINAGSADNEMTITNAIGAAYLTINGTAGKTLTLKGGGNGRFKVSNAVTVNNGMTLNWDVPGGFGRNGVNLVAGGNLRLRAEGYYGVDFKGIGTLTVAPPVGKTAIVDFDSKNYFRDGSGKFTALEVAGAGETIFRSRQAGIFSTGFTIPVSGGGKLTLETPCVGGSGAQDSAIPLFAISGATLAVRPNPHWSAECLSRSVWLSGGSIESAYDKFYFGPNGSGYPGLDIWVNGADNYFVGNYPIRLNGQLRLRAREGGGILASNCELANGGNVGSIALESGVTLKLAKSNSFSGGITVPGGARLVVDNAGGLGAGGVVVQAGGTFQMNAMPLSGVKSVTLESGAKLVLKSTGGGSYQMYSPATTSFTMADDVKVYDSTDEDTPLDGIVTPEGAYFISDAAKFWGNVSDRSWKNDAAELAWRKKDVEGLVGYADGDTVLFKNIANADEVTVPIVGDVNPGMMAFQNSTTAYDFTGSGTITVGSVATAGTTSFAPSIRATSQVSVGGKTTLGNVTTPSLNVAGGGALQLTGTATGIDLIGSIRFKASDTCGIPKWNDKMSALQISELQFFDAAGNKILFPVDTVIKDSVGNTTKITAVNGSVYTFSNDNSITRLFDGKCDTYHTIGASKQGPWSVTINLGTPIEMFKSFKYGYCQNFYISDQWARILTGCNYYPYANPYGWQVAVGDSETSLRNVITRGAERDASWYAKLSPGFAASGAAVSSKVTVRDGGTLYLNGTYNMPVTVNAGATLAVTNTSKATFSAAKTWPTGTYSMAVDTKEARRQSDWFQVTQNAGFSSTWLFRTDDDTAVKLVNGDLYVATAGVKAPPYSRTLGDSGNWNTAEWIDGKANAFDVAWNSAITKPTGSATLIVTGTNLTMNVDCSVNLDTLRVVTPTNCFPESFTATGLSALGISALDFREFSGKVMWNPPLAAWGTHVYVGTNDVTIASMTSGKGNLQVGAGGRATVPEKFAGYDVDKDAFVRFTGAHNFAMGDIPNKGCLSFKNTTLSGSFQNSLVKYVVEPDDTLTFTGDANNYNGRMSSSFDIRGGNVTINSNGATTWFGINGETHFTQTGGVFRCTANDTAMSVKNSGFLVGYSSTMTEDFEFVISGGRFEIPNTYINFFGPARFSITSNGVVQAKGVYKGGGNKGVVTVNAGAVFEIGSIGLVDGACDFNLYGGTVAGYENGAQTRGAVNLVGVGGFAAKANTTLTVNGEIKADAATLKFGALGYDGMVKLSAIPAGVTNCQIVAGRWDLGSLRPTNAVLTKLDGRIAAELTDDELRQAAKGGLRLIGTTLTAEQVADRVEVVTSAGAAVPATGSVKDGALMLIVDYVYPLYATASTNSWTALGWTDAIGMPFNGEWTNVTEAVLSNTLDGVTVAVSPDFTTKLTIVNTGALTIAGEAALATLDDSASSGRTRIACATVDVRAGLDTVIERIGSGTLTLGNGKCATMWNDVDWPTARIAGFSGTVKIRYAGDTTLTALKYTANGAGVVSYAQKVGMATETLQFNNTLTREFEDGIDMLVKRISMGNPSGSPTQTFRQTGGRIEAVSAEDMMANPTGAAPLLFAHWPGTVNYYLTGGELIATNGVTGSVYFGRDGIPCLYIGGGALPAVMRVNRFINDERSAGKDKTGSVVELKPNGRLEVGGLGFTLAKNAELRMSGGMFLAYETAAMSSSRFTLTAGTTSVLAAADGKTLTVNTVPTGRGALVCGCGGNDGTVILKGGSWGNVSLGGQFEIWLTAAQEAATKNVDLFVPGEAYDATKVSVRSSTGGEPNGSVCEYDGKITFVPSSAFRLPIVGEVYANNTPWSGANWHDSSAVPKAFAAANLPNFSDVVLNVESNATILCDLAQTLPALTVRGKGRATFVKGCALAITSAKIETDVVATNDAVTIAAADIASGSTLAPSSGGKLGNVTGGGTVECFGFCPTYANLTDATKWTGTARYVVNNAGQNDLDFSRMGNASSAIELAGTIPSGYPKNVDATIGKLAVSGSVVFHNGYSANTYAFGELEGDGSLKHTGTQTYKMKFAAAENFAGSLGTKGMQIGIGANAALAAKTIAVASRATIAAGKTWSADNGINVQNGGELCIAFRSDSSAASPSTVTVAQGGFLNLVQNAPSELVYKVTSGTLNLNGGVKVNGKTIAAGQYAVSGGAITLKGSVMMWNGGANGVWNTTSNCWRDASGADVAWNDGFAEGNVAEFANVATVALVEPVAPTLVNLAVPAAVLMHEGYVQTVPTVVFDNLNLLDVTTASGDMYGNYVSAKGAAMPCFVTRTPGQIGVQFQKRDGGHLKCVKVVMTQDGANVKAQAVWAAYAGDVEPGTVDFENASHNGTVVTADNGNGYGIKRLSVATAGHGELTVREAQNFAAPVIVTNGTLRLTAGEMTRDLALAAGARLDLAAEAYAVTNVITTGSLTGASLGNVTVNGAALSAEEWTLEGGKLIRDTSNWVFVREDETATIPAELSGRKVEVFVVATNGTLALDRSVRLNSMNVIGGALTLKVTDGGMLFATNGLFAGAVTLDASALDGVALAKCAVNGLPYSRWLVRGETLPAFAEVRLPEVPKHYSVTNETVAGVGVRLVVTAPVGAKFGAFGVNIHNGSGLDKTDVPSGVYPVAHALWGNLRAEAGKSTSVSNVTFAIGGNASGWSAGSAVDEIQKQYMDDNGNGERTITLSGLSAVGQYRIAVYFSTDSGNIKFCPVRVNGVPYASLGGLTVSDLNCDWGDTGPQGGSLAVAEGVNALVTDVLAADEVVLGFTRVNQGVARATPCAVQVVKVGEHVEPGKDFTATIDGDEYWEGICFSEIPWDGEAYEPGPNNTVTLTVVGDVCLAMDCELVLREFVVQGGEYDYLTFDDSESPSLDAALANVSAFDFGDVDGVYSPYDFGVRIVAFPRGYFALITPHAGTFQDGYSYQGDGNAFTGSGFAGAKVSVSADSTLAGDFDVTDGGMVNFGYGTVTSASSTFLGVTKGTVEIGAYTDVTVPHLRFLNSSDDMNHAALNLCGTLNVNSVSTQWNVWADRSSYKGILFGHLSGTGEYNVGIDPYDNTKRGRLVGEAAYLELVYTAGAQTLNISGGTVRVRGMMANKEGGTINLTNVGRLELAEGFGPNSAAIVQNYGEGTVSAYGYNGSTGWTSSQAVSFSGTTIDPNGLTIGFTGGITCEGGLTINDTSAGKGGKVVLGAGISGQGVALRVDGGTLELTASTTLGELTMATGAKLVLPATTQPLTVDAAVALDGVMIDVPAVQAATEGLVLIAAPSISGMPVAGANISAAGWTFVVADFGGGQVLKVVPVRKGTMIFVR